MRKPVMVAAAVAAALAAAACGTGKTTADSAAVRDSGAAAPAADSVALPAPGAPGTAPSPAGSTSVPNGAARPSAVKPAPKPTTATHPAAGTAKQEASIPKEPPPADTNPRPSNGAPAGATTPALVVFRDSVVTSDLDWLRGQGFTIVNVHAESHAVSVRVPQSYSGNPKANPRVLRFTMAMR